MVEPISPYHGLRAMPGRYGGEPFFAAGPTSSIDLIAGQAIESALLIAWCHRRFGGKVALAGISMTSFVAQQVASRCHLWPAEARPDAVMLISHSGRIEDVTFGGALAVTLGLDRALARAGWSREALARLSKLIDPAEQPALAPSNIVSVLGETDRWVPYDDGLAVARQWRLPEANVFRYPLGHLGMPVQLTRDTAPFERLRQVLAGRDVDAGDLAHQLGAHGAAEMVEVVGHDHERARPADDVLLVVLVEGEVGRAAEVGAVHHHRQAVDHDALLHQLVAHQLGRRAVVGAAVAGDVDDAPLGDEARIVEALAGMGERGADRRPALRRARRLGELLGEAARGGRAVDHGPVDHHHLVVRAGPFGVAERDALVLARQDGVDDAIVGECLDVAAALELGLDLVDRARHVDRQHELQIDRRLPRAPSTRRRPPPGSPKARSVASCPLSR